MAILHFKSDFHNSNSYPTRLHSQALADQSMNFFLKADFLEARSLSIKSSYHSKEILFHL